MLAVAGVEARLKWPNDVLLDGRKLAGVLAQRAASGEVVVGIGLNIGWAPHGAAQLGPGIKPLSVLTELLAALAVTAARKSPTAIEHCSTRWAAGCGSSCRRARSSDVPSTSPATAASIVIDECAITHHIEAGDVVHLRDGVTPVMTR